MAQGDITHAEIDGAALSTTATTTIYTIPAAKTAIFLSLTFCNFDTVARQLEIRIIESGGASGNTKRVVAQSTATAMLAGETQKYTFECLEAGTFIQASIDSGSSVNYRGSVTLKADS